MAMEVGGEIRQAIIVDASVTGAESLDGLEAKIQRLDKATNQFVTSGPAVAAYAAQLQSVGKGMEVLDVAGRGAISTAQLAAERYTLLTSVLKAGSVAFAELADKNSLLSRVMAESNATATQSMAAMGRERRLEVESMEQQIAAEVKLEAARLGEVTSINAATNAGFASVEMHNANNAALERATLRTAVAATESERYINQLGQMTIASLDEQKAFMGSAEALEMRTAALKVATDSQRQYITWAEAEINEEIRQVEALMATDAALLKKHADMKAAAASAPAAAVAGAGVVSGGSVGAAAAGFTGVAAATATERFELQALQENIVKVTAQAEAMTSRMVEGGKISKNAFHELITQVGLLRAEMVAAGEAGYTIGPRLAAGMRELGIAVNATGLQFEKTNVEFTKMSATANLAAGRARGVRGVLLGLGAEWAAQIFLVVAAAEQLYRMLKSLDEFLNSTKQVGIDWFDSWIAGVRKWYQSGYDHFAEGFAKSIRELQNLFGGSGGFGGASSGGSAASLMERFGVDPEGIAKKIQDEISARKLMLHYGVMVDMEAAAVLAPLIEQAKAWEIQMTGGTTRVDAAMKVFAAGMDEAAKTGGRAGEDLRVKYGVGLVKALQDAIDNARGLSVALSEADEKGKKYGYSTENMVNEMAARFSEGLRGAQTAGTSDTYLKDHAGELQKIVDFYDELRKPLPSFDLADAAQQLGMITTKMKDADDAAKKLADESKRMHQQMSQDAKAAFGVSEGYSGVLEDLQLKLDSLHIKTDLTPLEQGFLKIDDDVSKIFDGIKDKWDKVQERLKSGDATPKEAIAIKAMINGYDAVLVKLEQYRQERQKTFEQELTDKSIEKTKKALDDARDAVGKFAADWRVKTANLPQFLAAPINEQVNKISANFEIEIKKLQENFASLDMLDPRNVEEFEAALKDMFQTLKPVADTLLEPALKTAHALVDVLESEFVRLRDSFGAIFSAGITDGLDGILAAGKSTFKKLADDFGKLLADKVLIAFGAGGSGVKGAGKDGIPLSPEEINAGTAQKQAIANAALATFAGVSQALTQQMTDLNAGISAVVTGVSVGVSLFAAGLTTIAPYVGIIVAAAVFVAHLFQSAEAKKALEGGGNVQILPDYSAAGKLSMPRVSLIGSQNLTPGELAEINNSLQSTFDSFVNGYISILQKFGTDTFKNLQHKIDWGGVLGSWDTGDPSADWKGDMEVWLQQNLPRKIQDAFWTPLAEGFKKLGFSQERIDEIRAIGDNMKPEDAVKFFDSLVTTGLAIQDDLAKLNQPTGFGRELGDSENLQLRQSFEMSQDPFIQLQKTDDQITELAAGLSTLTGQAQIDRMNQIDAALKNRYASEMQLIGQIQNAIDSVTKSFGDAIRANQLALIASGTDNPVTNVNAQVDFLDNYLTQLYAQLANTTDPSKVTALSGDILKTIEQIKQIGGSLSPEDAKKFTEWAITAETEAQSIINNRLATIGAKLDSANDMLQDAIQGFIDSFLQATGSFLELSGGSTGGQTGGGLGGTIGAVGNPNDNNGPSPTGTWQPPPGSVPPGYVWHPVTPNHGAYSEGDYGQTPKGGYNLPDWMTGHGGYEVGGGGSGGSSSGGGGNLGRLGMETVPPGGAVVDAKTATAMEQGMAAAQKALQDIVDTVKASGSENTDIWIKWAQEAMTQLNASGGSPEQTAAIEENVRKGLETALGGALTPEQAATLSADMTAMVEALKANQQPVSDRLIEVDRTATDDTTTAVDTVNQTVQQQTDATSALLTQILAASRNGETEKYTVGWLSAIYDVLKERDAQKVEVTVRATPDRSTFVQDVQTRRVTRGGGAL